MWVYGILLVNMAAARGSGVTGSPQLVLTWEERTQHPQVQEGPAGNWVSSSGWSGPQREGLGGRVLMVVFVPANTGRVMLCGLVPLT